MENLNRYFDHTLLKPEATRVQIEKLCSEAKEYDFYSVCVNSSYVSLAKEYLFGTDVKVASVVGFPLGAMSTEAKVFETIKAVEDGADEIDMVLYVGRLKSNETEYVKNDIREVCSAAHAQDALVKVIIETCLLTDEEKVTACRLSVEAGADFVKTSTGFGTGGATAEDVALMKKTVGDRAKVKASGGIRDLRKVLEMIEAGADRIGASASVDIMKENK